MAGIKAVRLKRWKKANPTKNYRIGLKWKEKHPERHRAHKLVFAATQSGKLVRPMKCSKCGKTCKPQGHHPDYAKPLEVIWLCRQCHGVMHDLVW